MEDRQEVSLDLVRTLLECEGGTESNILQAHPELVDEGLVMSLRNIAQMMAAQNDPKSASTIEWLNNFAAQLAQTLGLGEESNSEDEESQLKFLMTVFQTIAQSKGNPQVIYSLWCDNLVHLDESLIPSIKTWYQTTFTEVDEDGRQSLAAVLGIFANRIQQFPLGSRLINLEIAIECYRLALSVYTLDAYPKQWASTQMNLAVAYSERIRGERAANLEEAIACYRLALSVRTQAAYPEDWALTQMNLANAYSERIRDERVANLELSIECCRLALSVYTFDSYPEQWAMTQINLAIVYSQRIWGDRTANLEEAIACYRLALSVRTQVAYPNDWAMTQMNLAVACSDLIWSERAANLEAAIECCEQALSVYTLDAYPEQWAKTQMNLATIYRGRIQGERAANLEEAIACYRLALSIYTLDGYPEQWAMTKNNLAVAYQHRIQGERATNLELSIACYQQALEIHKPEAFPIDALRASRGLGDVYFKQGEWQLASDAYAVSIEAAETSRNWATNEDERQRIIREAISVYQHTIQAYINLGRIDLAITTSERSRSRQLVDFMQINDLYPQGKVPDRVEEYVAVTKALQQYHQTDLPTDERSLATTSRSYTRSERAAAVIALETERQNILQEIRQEDAIAAGQMEVIPIEFTTIQGLIKTINTAILSFYTTDDDTHIFIITQAGEPQIFTLPGQGLQTFQQWLNRQWSLPYKLLDIKAEIEKMSPEEQQEFSAQINNIDETLLTSSWRNRMNDNLAAIANRLQLPQLIDRLPNHITELVIIPHLSLHQIPFAALPINPLRGGVPEGRGGSGAAGGSCLSDKFTIRYVPSCQILQYCTDRPSIESPRHGTVADTDGTLPGSGYESDRVAEIYQILDEFRLRGKQASKANYLDLLTNVNNLLSSHHASSHLDRPKKSCLKLADDVLTLGELLTKSNCYLNLNEVFLSCCETHLGDTLITDDILTLATGFLCAGARSVIGTLWRVDDLATSIFTIHYYQQRQQRASRSEAIQRSQSYLRNLTKEQILPLQSSLIAYTEKVEAEFNNIKTQPRNETTDRMLKELRAVYNAALDLQESLEQSFTIDRPFADPYYWAGFTCQGL